MQRINLSTNKRSAGHSGISPRLVAGVLLAVMLLIMGGNYLLLRHKAALRVAELTRLKARHTVLQEESRTYQQLLDKVKELEEQFARTQQKLQLAEGIKSQRRDWYLIVAAISRQVPEGVWLTEIKSAGRQVLPAAAGDAAVPQVSVTIAGRALGSAAIAGYLENLQRESDVLAAVDFSEVTRVAADDHAGIPAHFAFVISCLLK
ncbi:MAG: PilN domain-containing protein [Deltaproteobacteria bacterium]|nr:PilN domain-containing protein [Candidatus Anaeroferrophillus wilburensis]MBN2889430.1 PilN domain-containing protein [Deltaproteobacteria bacterium]